MVRPLLLGSIFVLFACGGDDRPSGVDGGGTSCGDTRCARGEVCCIDCDGHGSCGAPGTVCTGTACLSDGGMDGSTLACADTMCSAGEICCIDCDGHGDCGPPGTACPGLACPPDGGPPPGDASPPPACGSTTCGAGEICIQRQACPSGAPPEPECISLPTRCGTAPSCECFDPDPCGGCAMCSGVVEGIVQCGCVCICAAPDTPIATPDGERAIASLRPGDLVYSMSHGELVAVPLITVGRSLAPPDHAIVRVELASGRVLEMSPGHPTADGRHFGDLSPGEELAGAAIGSVELVPYGRPYTYDILPDSDTGTYVAAGALVGSTLARD
jgi:hypothetical protein